MGAPITAPATAAMPLITKACWKSSKIPTVTNNAETTAPAAAPTRIAGENTPPKKPKLSEIDVANILPIKMIIKKTNV